MDDISLGQAFLQILGFLVDTVVTPFLDLINASGVAGFLIACFVCNLVFNLIGASPAAPISSDRFDDRQFRWKF